MEATAAAGQFTAAPARASVPARALPGLFPPEPRDIDSAVRRVLLFLVLSLALVGAALYLMTSRAEAHLISVSIALAAAFGACAVPWHRLRRDAFAAFGIALLVWVTSAIWSTGGATSPIFPLTYLVTVVIAASLSRGLGVGLGIVSALLASLPLAYQQTTEGEAQNLIVRSVTQIGCVAFAAWLMSEVRRAHERAVAHEAQLASEQERASELRRAQTVRQEYLSVLAHELRNPLNAINAAARVLAKDLGEPTAISTARGIASEAHHAIELLDGLTDVASLESGRLRLALRPIDLAQVVHEVAAPLAEAHRIVVRGAEQPLWALGDDRRLGQVIRNLVTNAMRYSPPDGQVQISIGISADRKSAIVQVRDQGPGIPPAERARLFQKFARLSTAGGTRGSGLGLYISRGIVTDHGGEMWADWPAGGGSVFSFSVPLVGDGQRRSIP